VIAMHDEEFDLSVFKPLANRNSDEVLNKLRKKQLELDNAHELAEIESQHSLDYLFDELDL